MSAGGTDSRESARSRGDAALAAAHAGKLNFAALALIFGVMLAVLLELIDTSIVNVALPDMMSNLGATVDEASWIVTSYIIANVTIIPMTSWLASRFGRRRYLTFSILLFTAASALCGLSTSLWELVLFRILQGLGGGALLSSGQALMVEIFPPERQGTGQAIFGVGATLGPSLGPTLGGWLTDNFSWPWIFYVNLPLGLLAAFLIYNYLPTYRHARRAEGVDWPGIALLIVAIATLQYTIERGNHLDWFASATIRATAVLAILSGVGFVWHELRTPHPVVDLRVLRNKPLLVGCVYGAAFGVGLYGSIFLFPIFTQGMLHWSSWKSGIWVLPSTVTTALIMPFAGRAVMRTGPFPLIFAGMFVFLPALYGMSQWNLQSHGWDLIWPQMGRGIGLGLLFAPLSLAAMRYLHPKDVLQGAALYNLSRQTGGSLGIAVLATLLDHRADVHAAYLTEHVTSLSPATWQRLEMMRAGLAARGLDPAEALNGAYQLLHGVIEREATVLAFRDSYYFVILVIGALLPFVWIFRSKAFDLRNLGGGAAAASGPAPEASPDALAAGSMAH
ncbi:MAG: DHA2 family efflux MFS transporter permease subunit [Myxococcota bacterium]